MTSAVETLLPDRLAHRQWVRREWPFAHVVAQNVFTPEFYESLHEQTVAMLNDEVSFERNLGTYDATSTMITDREGPLSIFISRAWHDLIANIWGINATGDVSATLHHHAPGGKSGWPHNDLNPSWFPGGAPREDEVRLVDNTQVHNQFGRVHQEGVEVRETMRAVALLFYLGNPEWENGDGGETALFESNCGSRRGPSAAVPPINNSLVMFECTPFSWHSFVSNQKPRTSVVMWIHRPKEEVVARWGEQSIVYW